MAMAMAMIVSGVLGLLSLAQSATPARYGHH